MLKIVFFGSGPVAEKSLKLLAKNFQVEAVITKPSTLEQMSNASNGAPVFVASTKAELDSLMVSSTFSSKLAILIDFGIIISEKVISYFPLGIVNSHFSVLPELRGADPISFAILSGQKSTGVSLMLIDEGMDTGELLAIDTTPVSTEETTPSLTEKLIRLSDDLLTKNIPLYIEGEISPYGQPNPENATYSRKLTKADGIIDWSKPANIIDCEIRAFLEWPKSRTSIAGKDIIVTKSHYSSEQIPDAQLGKAMVVNSKELGVVTSKGTLWIDELKPAGKKQMSAEAFIAGHGHLL